MRNGIGSMGHAAGRRALGNDRGTMRTLLHSRMAADISGIGPIHHAGIGESAGIITLAAAIGNAFYNATGVRMRMIPMTPANVLAALGKTQGEMAV